MFRKPLQQTLKADHTSRVSRCAVCIRRYVTEESFTDRNRTPHVNSHNSFGQPTANYYPKDTSNEIEDHPRNLNYYYEHQRNHGSGWLRTSSQHKQQLQNPNSRKSYRLLPALKWRSRNHKSQEVKEY
jgi:hypothetical protein